MLRYPHVCPHTVRTPCPKIQWSKYLYRTKTLIFGAAVMALSLSALAQQETPKLRGSKAQPQLQTRPAKLTPQQKFVMDTVNMAVALPEPDPQDRLRVLSSAADVVSTI